MAVHAETRGIAPTGQVRRGATGGARGEVLGRGVGGIGTTTLVTATQLAERWQVPVRTVYAWARRNAIPHYRAGRMLRFDLMEVEEYFRSHGFAEEVASDPERPGESAFALLNG